MITSYALRDNVVEDTNARGHLYSVDSDQGWTTVTMETMPEELTECCSISYCPLIETEEKGILGFKYMNVPSVKPDFIYLDGPELTEERQVAFNFLDLEDKLEKGAFLLIDGRKENHEYIVKHCKHHYSVKRSELFDYSTLELACH